MKHPDFNLYPRCLLWVNLKLNLDNKYEVCVVIFQFNRELPSLMILFTVKYFGFCPSQILTFNLFTTSEPPKYSNSNSPNLLLWFFCLIKSSANCSGILCANYLSLWFLVSSRKSSSWWLGFVIILEKLIVPLWEINQKFLKIVKMYTIQNISIFTYLVTF